MRDSHENFVSHSKREYYSRSKRLDAVQTFQSVFLATTYFNLYLLTSFSYWPEPFFLNDHDFVCYSCNVFLARRITFRHFIIFRYASGLRPVLHLWRVYLLPVWNWSSGKTRPYLYVISSWRSSIREREREKKKDRWCVIRSTHLTDIG